MRLRQTRSWAWTGTGLLLVLLSGGFHRPLINQRAEDQLQTVAPEDTTPLVALTTVAFGGFRGLVADALWIRAGTLQENGQFFEMVQLAQWITQLEPRAPKVWSFQAWNLSYNISSLFPEHEDRWRWISHGFRLLKEDGLTHNPASASLHWDIGWMYQHKIGMDLDQGHFLYKQRLAEGVEELLPRGRLPDTPLDAEVQERFRKDWQMDPEVMRELEEEFGPVDWRLPEAHSLYWATQGLNVRGNSFERSTLERMKRQSLLTMIRAGTLVRDSESGFMLTLPRLDLIPHVEALYRAEWDARPESETARTAYVNVLLEACVVYSEMGQAQQALAMYEILAGVDPRFENTREGFHQILEHLLSIPPESLSRAQAMSRVVTLLVLAEEPSLSSVRSRGRVQMAKQTHRAYQESLSTPDLLERSGLPPFEVMQELISWQNLWEDEL